MGSFVRTMERKQARKMAKEEETSEEETTEGAPDSGDGLELSSDEVQALLIDAEVFVRTGAEKLDELREAGVVDDELCAKINDVAEALFKLVDES
jgi:hypothetical protein